MRRGSIWNWLSKPKPPKGSGLADLTPDEREVAKKLFQLGWTGQDILNALNIGRKVPINSGRLTSVKNNSAQKTCSDEALSRFFRVKEAFDLRTGLNPYIDERLFRAREAMMTAVQIFNSPSHKFKSEQFAVMSNIAWTYLCHERLLSLGISIHKTDGKTFALSYMIGLPELALSKAIQSNLLDIKSLRDAVEHELLEQSDVLWRGLFQANCINFDAIMCEWFGDQLSLADELSFSLQFSKANLEQLSQLAAYDIPPSMQSLNDDLRDAKSTDVTESAEYEFSVVYTFVSGAKNTSHINFVTPDSAAGLEISNVLIKEKVGDHLYPFKPSKVAELVSLATGKKFTPYKNAQAWSVHKVRPAGINPKQGTVNGKYCCYHPTFKDYTYNQEWVDLLISENMES